MYQMCIEGMLSQYSMNPKDLQYFHYLNGMRGLAALIIVMYHRRFWFGSAEFAGHAYLGVDFFFMLSGFVLVHAYEQQLLKGMTLVTFLKKRIVRLYPLIVLSSVLGGVAAYGRMHGHKIAHDPHLAANVLATSLAIPNVWAKEYFGLNRPLWTLFWEMLASVWFGAVGYRLNTKHLIITVIIAEILTIYAALHYNSVLIGNDPQGFIFGLARVIFGVGVGMLMYRLYKTGRFASFRIGLAGPVVLVATFFLLPPKTLGHQPLAIYYNIFVVLFLYPVIIFGSVRQEPLFPVLSRISGALSYPLYVLHEPLLFLLSGALVVTHISKLNSGPFEGALRIAFVMMVCWLCLIALDEPLRQWLGRLWSAYPAKMRTSRASVPGPQGITPELASSGSGSRI